MSDNETGQMVEYARLQVVEDLQRKTGEKAKAKRTLRKLEELLEDFPPEVPFEDWQNSEAVNRAILQTDAARFKAACHAAVLEAGMKDIMVWSQDRKEAEESLAAAKAEGDAAKAKEAMDLREEALRAMELDAEQMLGEALGLSYTIMGARLLQGFLGTEAAYNYIVNRSGEVLNRNQVTVSLEVLRNAYKLATAGWNITVPASRELGEMKEDLGMLERVQEIGRKLIQAGRYVLSAESAEVIRACKKRAEQMPYDELRKPGGAEFFATAKEAAGVRKAREKAEAALDDAAVLAAMDDAHDAIMRLLGVFNGK